MSWVLASISGERILMKGRIVCGAVIEDWLIPFAAYTAAETPNAWAGQPSKIAPFCGGSLPHLFQGSLGPHESAPKQHFDRFSTIYQCGKNTDTHTDTKTMLRVTFVAIDRIYAIHVPVRLAVRYPCTYLALPVIYIALLFVILKQQKFNKSSWHMGSRPNLNLNPNQRAFRPMWHTQFCRATLSHNFSTHAFITRQNCSMQLCMSHTATLSHKQELTNRRSATKLHRIEHCSIRKGVVQLLKSCAKNRRCDILS